MVGEPGLGVGAFHRTGSRIRGSCGWSTSGWPRGSVEDGIWSQTKLGSAQPGDYGGVARVPAEVPSSSSSYLKKCVVRSFEQVPRRGRCRPSRCGRRFFPRSVAAVGSGSRGPGGFGMHGVADPDRPVSPCFRYRSLRRNGISIVTPGGTSPGRGAGLHAWRRGVVINHTTLSVTSWSRPVVNMVQGGTDPLHGATRPSEPTARARRDNPRQRNESWTP